MDAEPKAHLQLSDQHRLFVFSLSPTLTNGSTNQILNMLSLPVPPHLQKHLMVTMHVPL
jgi:hypothetical protein